MTDPKVYKRGRRTYTRVGAHTEVRLEGAPKEAAVPTAAFEVPNELEQPLYANAAAVHRSPDEIIVDLAFAGPGRSAARVRTRIAMSPQLASRLARLLARAAEES